MGRAVELRHLRYFIAAAEEENFHRAAERLHISQPALSRRIRDLEDELGFDLFQRGLKRVHLSRAGRAFLESVRRSMADLDKARVDGARIAKGQSGTLNVGFFESLIVRYPSVARSFREFRSGYPEVELRLNAIEPAHGLDALRRGEIDAAFLFDIRLEGDELRTHFIASETWILAVPAAHPLAVRPAVRLADLGEVPFIWSRRELAPPLYDDLISRCRDAGITPNIIQSAGSESTKVHLVAAGMGVSFVLSGARPADEVVFRKVDDLDTIVRADLVWRHDKVSAQLANFVDLVRRNAPDEAGSLNDQTSSRR